MYGASVDLTDGIYQFLTQSVASWFCFDAEVTGDEFGVSEIWDDASRTMVPVAGDAPLFPAFLGMPMGWKWALYICRSVVEDVVGRTVHGLGGSLVDDKNPSLRSIASGPIRAPCVGNLMLTFSVRILFAYNKLSMRLPWSSRPVVFSCRIRWRRLRCSSSSDLA